MIILIITNYYEKDIVDIISNAIQNWDICFVCLLILKIIDEELYFCSS